MVKDIFSLAKTRKEFYLLAENVFFFFNKGVIIRGGCILMWPTVHKVQRCSHLEGRPTLGMRVDQP